MLTFAPGVAAITVATFASCPSASFLISALSKSNSTSADRSIVMSDGVTFALRSFSAPSNPSERPLVSSPPAAAPPAPSIGTATNGRKCGRNRSTALTESGGAWNVSVISVVFVQSGTKAPWSIFTVSGWPWNIPSESFISGYLRLPALSIRNTRS
jgi:hypothetical protein